MEEIDQKLDHWVHNSLIRAEIRKVIENHILNEKTHAYKAGWTKGAWGTYGSKNK